MDTWKYWEGLLGQPLALAECSRCTSLESSLFPDHLSCSICPACSVQLLSPYAYHCIVHQVHV